MFITSNKKCYVIKDVIKVFFKESLFHICNASGQLKQDQVLSK